MAKAMKKKAVAAKVTKKKTAAAKATKKKTTAAKATKKKTTAAKSAKKTTESVLQHHVQALLARKLDEIIKDYCEESVVCMPTSTARGLKEIRDTFATALKMLTPEALSNMKNIKQDIDGEYCYALWSAMPVIRFAGDTFHVRDGKILLQTVVTQLNP